MHTCNTGSAAGKNCQNTRCYSHIDSMDLPNFITKLYVVTRHMVELGFSEMLSIAQTIGIVGTMVLTLYFSKKHIQSLSIHQQTRVLNDLDEKVRKMAEIIIEKPTMQKVIYKLEKPSEELAFVYYILFICSHVYSMRQKNVLNNEEWTGWLHWMTNCFKYWTIGEQWKQIESEGWLNPAFENFVNKEIVGAILKPNQK